MIVFFAAIYLEVGLLLGFVVGWLAFRHPSRSKAARTLSIASHARRKGKREAIHAQLRAELGR